MQPNSSSTAGSPGAGRERGDVLVLKIGGSVLADGPPPALLDALSELNASGTPTVLVHGGGSHVTELLDRLGLETEFVDGLRVTPDHVMEVVEMVLAGRVNKSLVSALQGAGMRAAGISGKDGATLHAEPHPDAGRLGRVGEVTSSDTRLVRSLLAGGFLPVVCSVAGGEDGGTYNVNADEAAAALAAALSAGRLVLLTDVPGFLEGGDGEVVAHMTPDEVQARLSEGSAAGGMRPKLRACLRALDAGAGSAHVLGVADAAALPALALGESGPGTTVSLRLPREDDGAPPAEPAPTGPAEESTAAAARHPATDAVAVRARRHILGTYAPLPLAFRSGRGVRLRGLDGREYLDFIGGIAVSTLGHGHPDLTRALSEQASRYMHVSNLYLIPEQVRAAELLVEASGLDRVFFCNSGAESVEGAIKVARKWGRSRRGAECHEIVVMDGAFHGRTLGALSATANPAYREQFEPLVPGFVRVPFNDADAVADAVGPDTCAVLVEPLQGEAGVIPGEPGYLERLRALTREREVLLVLDEVQTGVGRTGSMFAYQHYGIEPDVVAVSKGLGGGVPVGAVLVEGEVAGVMAPGDHATTFGGNALASAAVTAVMENLLHGGGLERARDAAAYLRERLEGVALQQPGARGVRGIGLLLALEVEVDAKELARDLAGRGLLVNGMGSGVLRFAPPLVVDRASIDQAVEILEEALTAAPEGQPRPV